MFVVRRGDRCWFRKAVPVDLVDVVGIAEIRQLLRTSNAREARRRALEVLVRVKDVYAALRTERPLRPARDAALAMLQQALDATSGSPWAIDRKGRFFGEVASVLRGMGDGDLSGGERDDPPDLRDVGADGRVAGHAVKTHDALRILQCERPAGDENRIAVAILRAVARMSGGHLEDTATGARDLDASLSALSTSTDCATAPSTAFPFEQLRALLASELAKLRALAFDAQAIREMIASEVRAGVTRAATERWSSMPLSQAIAKFEVDEVRNRGGAKHQEDAPRRLASFLRAIGDKPIREITQDDLRACRDLLDQAPDRFTLRFGTHDVAEAIAANRRLARPFRTIEKVTVDLKYIGPVRRIFEFLGREKLLGSNPVNDIRSTQKETSSSKVKRLPLKPAHIAALLTRTAKEPVISATYWVPAIMLFSGARPGEIELLKVGNLDETFNSRPHLSVLCLKDDEDEEPDEEVTRKPPEDLRRVKTEAARRMIPVHPMLVRMGLLDLFHRCRRGPDTSGLLFRDVKPIAHGSRPWPDRLALDRAD